MHSVLCFIFLSLAQVTCTLLYVLISLIFFLATICFLVYSILVVIFGRHGYISFSGKIATRGGPPPLLPHRHSLTLTTLEIYGLKQ